MGSRQSGDFGVFFFVGRLLDSSRVSGWTWFWVWCMDTLLRHGLRRVDFADSFLNRPRWTRRLALGQDIIHQNSEINFAVLYFSLRPIWYSLRLLLLVLLGLPLVHLVGTRPPWSGPSCPSLEQKAASPCWGSSEGPQQPRWMLRNVRIKGARFGSLFFFLNVFLIN